MVKEEVQGFHGSTLRLQLESEDWRQSQTVWSAQSKWREHPEHEKECRDLVSKLQRYSPEDLCTRLLADLQDCLLED